MYKNKGYYEAFSGGDRLEPGSEIKIDHIITFRPEGGKLSELVALPRETLQARRDGSAAAEKVIFENLRGMAEAWEEQASQTMLLDRAIEYINTLSVEHTANKWQLSERRNVHEISNMVYKMWYGIDNDTAYSHEKKQSLTVVWLTWDVWTNGPLNDSARIAGQYRKRFTDKAAMEKYLQGRINAYSHLFTELSPPIPKEFERYFTVNGQLLPGYTVEGQEPKLSGRAAEPQKDGSAVPAKRESALGRLAAAKEVVAQNGAPKADRPKEKPRGPEL